MSIMRVKDRILCVSNLLPHVLKVVSLLWSHTPLFFHIPFVPLYYKAWEPVFIYFFLVSLNVFDWNWDFSLFKNFFLVYSCMCVCTWVDRWRPGEWFPRAARRECQSFWSWNRSCHPVVWMVGGLETKLRSLSRAAIALDCWAVSPAPVFLFE